MLTGFKSYGFETILNPRSQCPYTGKETVKILDNNVKLYADEENGSYRFVMYKKGRSISALQLMKRPDKDIVVVANVLTVKQHRRKGYAKIVWNEAKKLFPIIQHSSNLSEDGKIFATKCN